MSKELIIENDDLKKRLAIAEFDVVKLDYHLANTMSLLDDMLDETAGFFDFYSDNEELVTKARETIKKYRKEMSHG